MHEYKTIPEYCDGCHKIVDGKCSVYVEPCRAVGGWGSARGCCFSPMEVERINESLKQREITLRKRLIGQQKQAKKSKAGTWHKLGRKSRR